MRDKFSKILLISFLLLPFLTAKGQGVKNIRINEVLVKNDNNYVDPYGVRCSWFEVFNTDYATVDLGGCYVTNDINEPKKYRIPKGNPKTKIAARAYALFFAYDKGDRGIFHVNFSLEEKGFLALYDQSGRVLIDSVNYDISAQKPNLSFGKMENEPKATAIRHFDLEPTPEASNYVSVEESRAEKYKRIDPTGGIITVTTMTVVFTVLLILALIFTKTGKYFKRKADENKAKRDLQILSKTGKYIKKFRKNTETETEQPVENKPTAQSTSDADDLDMAAIATALYLHFDDQHEVEQTGFYLNRPLNQQTAWASKNILFKKSPVRKR